MGHGKRFSPEPTIIDDEPMAHPARRHHGKESRAAKRARQGAQQLLRHRPKEIAMTTAAPRCSRRHGARGAAWPRAQVAPQTESDAYTRYELLAPGSAKFRIIYEVTANTAGRDALLQSDSQRQRRDRRERVRSRDGQAARVRRRRQRDRACRRRAQQRHDADLHSREARPSRSTGRRRGARVDQQDVRRRRELLRRAATRSSSLGRSASSAIRSCCRRATS